MDVSISSTNTTLLSFDNISLNTGNIYAFTGPSGSGKSSANSKILGIKHNGIKGVGSITYPGDSLDDVSLVTQKDYIPQNSSLYEVLMYPRSKNEANSLNETYSQKILDLLTFLENDGTRDLVQELHQVKDWNSELSGGQVKKISIIRGLISDDKVIIFDEVFTGLDKKLLVRAQKLIKQYSQENQAVIIVVDHSAQDNNYNEFYTGELYVLNKKVDLRKLPSREIPEGYLEEKNEFLTCSIEHTWAEENFSVCMMGNISTIEEL